MADAKINNLTSDQVLDAVTELKKQGLKLLGRDNRNSEKMFGKPGPFPPAQDRTFLKGL
ncbi:hypothetical protein [Pseudomonas sivasensis]|uniref:hypothetical protein n=1 Tax=Pseudomonas sivasensis TaxID=1880678 RepID=UPI003B9F7CD3